MVEQKKKEQQLTKKTKRNQKATDSICLKIKSAFVFLYGRHSVVHFLLCQV